MLDEEKHNEVFNEMLGQMLDLEECVRHDQVSLLDIDDISATSVSFETGAAL